VAAVTTGILGNAATWAIQQNSGRIPFREYLWPQGVLVFLIFFAGVFIIDNIRLRRRLAQTKTVTTPTVRYYYPLELSAVLGRDNEIDQVINFVMSDERKFLCLLGPGGVGKTTVARAALGRLDHLRVAFVEVEAINERDRQPLAVDQAFAVAVATRGLGMGLVSQESPVDAVANALRLIETRTVLVIDNVEQVKNRAASIIHRWVQENSLVRVIVTSRVELNVGTEKLLEIDIFEPHPLDLNSTAMLNNPGPALELFARRRNDRHRGFRLAEDNIELVNKISHAVGGLPLGIELAASVERTLQEIEDGIKKSSAFLASSRPDLPERQRSLAATIDWGLDLLDQHSYALALQLSVAPGELDDQAINNVVHIPAARRTHELLSALVAANLLVRHEVGGRSTYREPIEVRRRCAELRLISPREADRGAWTRFAVTFMARAEAAYSERYRNAVREALDALERDYDNLLAVTQCV
jgi:predicted ATPase